MFNRPDIGLFELSRQIHRHSMRQLRSRVSYVRRLKLESLEDRRLLTITVNTLIDENNGSGNGFTSLREAIAVAAVGETITFSVTGTINLTSISGLSIDQNLTITGPGADRLTIRAYDPTPTLKNGDGGSVFHINDGTANDIAVSISGLTLTGGDAPIEGGGILNAENLTLTRCMISGNSAQRTGGGISSSGGSLTIVGSTISGNTAVTHHAGGIYSGKYGALTLISSTISGNRAAFSGGGLYSFRDDLTIEHSTITGNRANFDNNASGQGGGIRRYGPGTEVIRHTIVAGNSRGAGMQDDISGDIAAQFSLVGVGTGATITSLGGNQIGTSGAAIDPLLGPLANNAGPTSTHALLSGSPAIDRGDPAAASGMSGIPVYDQRGQPFTRVVDGNGAQGARIDIGAFELQTISPVALGDFNRDGTVDAADYVAWRKTLNSTVSPFGGADGDGDGRVDQDDWFVWRAHFRQVLTGGAGAGSNASAIVESTPETSRSSFSVRDNESRLFLATAEHTASLNQRLLPLFTNALQFFALDATIGARKLAKTFGDSLTDVRKTRSGVAFVLAASHLSEATSNTVNGLVLAGQSSRFAALDQKEAPPDRTRIAVERPSVRSVAILDRVFDQLGANWPQSFSLLSIGSALR
jgi:hypothetical protein